MALRGLASAVAVGLPAPPIALNQRTWPKVPNLGQTSPDLVPSIAKLLSSNTSSASTGKSVVIRVRNDTEHPEHDAPCSQITGVVRNGNRELRTLRQGPIMPRIAQAATIERDDAPRIERKFRREISISLAP